MGLSLQPPDNARFIQIVRGHLHFDTVADGESNPALAHLPGDGWQDEVLIVELNSEHGSRQNRVHHSFDLDGHFFQKAV
jgi:hypothetical protein